MGIDFHEKKNRNSYTTRKANQSWIQMVKELVPINNTTHAVDIGCGGGIYCKALADMGVATVTGVDFSKVMIEGAIINCENYPNISFQKGNAFETGLKGNYYDLLLERALIHHIEDLESCFKEAYRVLKKGGYLIIQDRTPADCLLPGDEQHIRGYFFELFPKLGEKEIQRRHSSNLVMETLTKAGFKEIEEVKLWEIRNIYDNKVQLLDDLKERTGRSILHELDDKELNLLIHSIDDAVSKRTNIIEKDRWTIWKAVKR
ncbi:methyltransferase domain-containing protein [Ureibacillus sp. 179-F W5.1 NHS]|uniref:SAM-dependent methyltransferase n=1 Tax=Lysinibacillus halotolerans TaxID=1368476 RepID=A0A3M8H747_9BACI|nr:class I SAM-dependent methyltransferase [Lysinibacillus halotolerans]RNC98044.1 SAM-dependent methyltransferase [Lysinibacillus halotolerans]